LISADLIRTTLIGREIATAVEEAHEQDGNAERISWSDRYGVPE
jgi:predicted AAA+ superfamily ATPase